MLVLTRRPGQEIVIGGCVRVQLLSAGKANVRLGITAPDEIRVDRKEVHEKLEFHTDQWDESFEMIVQSQQDLRCGSGTRS